MKEAKLEVKPKVQDMFKKGEELLLQQFNSYSFGIELNKNDQKDIMDDVYNKFLKSQLDSLND